MSRNKAENQEMFERIGKHPQHWLRQAEQLKMSADVILPELKKALEDMPSFPGVQDRRLSFSRSYMFLMGVAVENLIKGILIGRNPALISQEKIDVIVRHRSGHGIAKGAQEITSLCLSPDEINLLQRMEEYLFWAARYPLPKNSEVFHNSETHSLLTYRGNDPLLIDNLFKKLADILTTEQKTQNIATP